MTKLPSFLRLGLLALGACLALMPWRASAQQVPQVITQLGLIGAAQPTPVQIAEMRVTYRFDQMDTGKSAQAVPVQMTYRLHNPSDAQSLDLLIPLAGSEGEAPEITAIFVNGQERPLPDAANVSFYNSDQNIRAASVNISLPKDSDLIVDIRALQPVTGENLSFAFKTGRAWGGHLPSGTLEAFFPFTTANWNVVMRKLKTPPEVIPLAYAGKTATWSLTDLDLKSADDVFWQTADLEAMTYYEQGLNRWQQSNNDPEAYTMLHRALLDMIPCRGLTMPLTSWWNNLYETITVGVISTLSNNEEQSLKALELWSADWSVPQGDEVECAAMQQRPERYQVALQSLMAMPKDQRSAAVENTLIKHYKFLHELAAIKGGNSLQDNPSDLPKTDPLGNSKLSEDDRRLLAQWDARFASPQQTLGQTGATGAVQGQPTTAKQTGATVSSTLNNLLQKLPKLSFGTQIIFFGILALIVLIIMGYIIFKWQETPTLPQRPTENLTKSPTVPLMGMGLGTKINLADTHPTKEPIKNEASSWFKPDKEADLIKPPTTEIPKPPTPAVPVAQSQPSQTPPISQPPKPWEPPRPAPSDAKPHDLPPEKIQPPKPPLTI